MSAPLTFLAPAIDLIARNASVLPAVGGAFEDLARPAIEEADDRFFGSQGDAEQGFDTFAEVPTPDWGDLYRPTLPVYREQDHVFRYFCDGSIKTYFLGTIIENDRSYPLELTQIGSAIVYRKPAGSLAVARSERRILLLVPYSNGRGISETLYGQLLQRMMFMLNESYQSKSFSIFGGGTVAASFRKVIADFQIAQQGHEEVQFHASSIVGFAGRQ